MRNAELAALTGAGSSRKRPRSSACRQWDAAAELAPPIRAPRAGASSPGARAGAGPGRRRRPDPRAARGASSPCRSRPPPPVSPHLVPPHPGWPSKASAAGAHRRRRALVRSICWTVPGTDWRSAILLCRSRFAVRRWCAPGRKMPSIARSVSCRRPTMHPRRPQRDAAGSHDDRVAPGAFLSRRGVGDIPTPEIRQAGERAPPAHRAHRRRSPAARISR